MITCFIALGSNLGDRHKNIKTALSYLKKDPSINVVKVSSLIETKAVGGPRQPKYLNGVAKVETNYSAHKLLHVLQHIEQMLGRRMPHPKNHPRTIDLDILLYGDATIDEKGLKIPHPRMWKREFVTVPLQEIAPDKLR